ncbi:MAG: hypothetical protein M3Q27_07500 [Actinomycetota bacterium]|nr:hypothetical protein [Actinomycetota bacterium]
MTPHPVMGALSRGVPITLLCDLFDPRGPRSQDIYAVERDEDALLWTRVPGPRHEPRSPA